MKRVRFTASGILAVTMIVTVGLSASASSADVSRTVQAPSSDVTATATLRVMSHNICGASCHGGDTTAPTRFLLDEMRLWPPHVVMLQEVCYGQYERIRDELAPDFTTHFVAMRESHVKCPGASALGQVLAARGAMTGAEEIDLNGDSYDADGRKYTALCRDLTVANLGVGKVKACVTHIRAFHRQAEPWHSRARWAQLGKLAAEMDDDLYADNQVVVLGGDFNSHPHETSMDPIYRITKSGDRSGLGMFVEADQTDRTYFPASFGCASECRSGEPTFRTRKYDYIFFSAAHASNLSGGVKGTGGSDHNLYRGRADIAV